MKLGKRAVRKMQLLGFEEYYLLDLYKLVYLVSLFFHRLLRIYLSLFVSTTQHLITTGIVA